jgi:hypothetical protein
MSSKAKVCALLLLQCMSLKMARYVGWPRCSSSVAIGETADMRWLDLLKLTHNRHEPQHLLVLSGKIPLGPGERRMRRRAFITLLGGAAVVLPLAARAQQSAKIWRMGFIAHGHESFYDALFEGLRDYGYVEGQNLIVERRFARGNAALFKDFAAEMVRLNVDIIVVVTTPAALAVKNATTTIPIVHPNAIDPLNTGLIASLAHPGGNLTGGAQLTAEASAKRLQILKKVVPKLSRAAILWNPGNSAWAGWTTRLLPRDGRGKGVAILPTSTIASRKRRRNICRGNCRLAVSRIS